MVVKSQLIEILSMKGIIIFIHYIHLKEATIAN